MWLRSCEFIDLAKKKKRRYCSQMWLMSMRWEVKTCYYIKAAERCKLSRSSPGWKERPVTETAKGNLSYGVVIHPERTDMGPRSFNTLSAMAPICLTASSDPILSSVESTGKRRRKSFSIITIIIIRLHLKINCGTCCACSPLKKYWQNVTI